MLIFRVRILNKRISLFGQRLSLACTHLSVLRICRVHRFALRLPRLTFMQVVCFGGENHAIAKPRKVIHAAKGQRGHIKLRADFLSS